MVEINLRDSNRRIIFYKLDKSNVMAKIKITQIKSAIDRPQRQKDTVKALGLKKMNQTVEHEATPQILGMVKKISHLLKVEEV